jgi:hypothetical protein
MRPRFSSSELVILLFLEALFLTYIVLDTIDMLYILGLFLLFVFFVIILIKLYRIYGRSPHIVQDLDDNRHYDRFKQQLMGSRSEDAEDHWLKGLPIAILFVTRIVVTYFFVIYDWPLLFLFIFSGFLSLMEIRLIELASENTWLLFNYLTTIIASFILVFYYIDFMWVKIAWALQILVWVMMFFDLDYGALKAFVPPILTLLVFYNDPIYGIWVLPVAVINFLFSYYSLVLH